MVSRPRRRRLIGINLPAAGTGALSCTVHSTKNPPNRFGGVRQVVAVERDGLALRLYLFDSAPRRVHSVDGLVTAIRP